MVTKVLFAVFLVLKMFQRIVGQVAVLVGQQVAGQLAVLVGRLAAGTGLGGPHLSLSVLLPGDYLLPEDCSLPDDCLLPSGPCEYTVVYRL